ncbi:hypothetical protein BD324DRAFT_300541 [Kockovaella imperatae]|uniref:Carboxylic ester hydrolase n=1 Tax=Kockovaella imperatae TaxID=4999 RepID=A0A1Y1ULT6_9TREE|nr:hypothetical protein BD324DRAFT_300541 [Kockovaella imperatae]ORX38959.1 hypothetical protein BD324DRAFT_300541 [Kockovaella imperatae]
MELWIDMVDMWSLSLVLLLSASCRAWTAVDSSVTILTHNDLYGNSSWRDESLLVLSKGMTAGDASEACERYGEKLWCARYADFLPYLEYEGRGGLYWAKGMCVNITADGLQDATCTSSQQLPALCTNSAPLSSATMQNNSTYWQVQVKTNDQHITGYRDKHAFRFEGVRYAAQPERFTYSTVYETDTNTTALAFGSECVQSPDVGSEDCLFLNIWTPYLPGDSNTPLKPVMLNIHGGAFTAGTGNDPNLDGGALASRGDVVVVGINYRLTTLGFLALDNGETNGNYGLADQVTALEWVQKHIAAFGGDPSRVTILGQSAGAGSVRALIASPKAKDLFVGALPQSNLAGFSYATTYSEYLNISAEVDIAANPILNATGCLNATSHLDCLRKIDPFVLANLSTVARYVVQDGEYITSDRLEITEPSQVNNVHLMMGFMRDDGASFGGYPTASENLTTLLTANGFGPQLSPSTLELYPVPSGPNATLDIYNASSAMVTDGEFRCLDEATAYSAALHKSLQSIWFYQFNRSYNGYDPHPPVCEAPITPSYPYGDPEMEYFKCHSGDLSYTFGTMPYVGLPDRDGLDIPMSQFIVDTWASFARSYNPNPNTAFLDARGFTNSSAMVRMIEPWSQVSVENQTLRVFQYPSFQADFEIFSSTPRCDALGLDLKYYENSS